jgi:hypothetical protein
VEITCLVYRPRRARESPLFHLVEQHIGDLLSLEPVPHRHVLLTMPRLLRGIFRKRRELLLDLSQCAAEAVAEYTRRQLGADTRPGIVVSIATSGDLPGTAKRS